MIEEVSLDRKDIMLEYLLYIAEQDGLNKSYTHIFCKLLEQNWHEWHEDIVIHLEIIKDPESIESIYKSTFMEKDFHDDEPCPLTKKCIWALSAINTHESREKIQILSNSSNLSVKETALMELNHIRS
jgi:hypothetical protein